MIRPCCKAIWTMLGVKPFVIRFTTQIRDPVYLAYPIMRLPNTVPIPAPEPATPTVAAPAPMNLAAVSMSRLTALVWKPRTATWERADCGRKAGLAYNNMNQNEYQTTHSDAPRCNCIQATHLISMFALWIKPITLALLTQPSSKRAVWTC